MFLSLFPFLLSALQPNLEEVVIPDMQAVCVMDDRSKQVVYQKNGHEALVPASILKVLGGAAVLDTLGYDYQFKTEFYSSEEPVLLPDGRLSVKNLYIKGYGDPTLVSEELATIVNKLPAMVVQDALIIDTSYFADDLGIIQEPGVLSPYNALNSAFAVNYNTLAFSVSNVGLEPEEKTPFVPYVKYSIDSWRKRSYYVDLQPQKDYLQVITKGRWTNSPKKFRIHLGFAPEYGIRYAAWLFLTMYQEAHKVELTKQVNLGKVPENSYHLLTYTSPSNATTAVHNLLEYSNNFIANQLLLIAGAERFGAPATMEKGLALMRDWLQKHEIEGVELYEASGLDPRNRISACNMTKILLAAFDGGKKAPELLHHANNFYYKTGTFPKNGVRNIAGYLQDGNSMGTHVAAFMCNGPNCPEEVRLDHLTEAAEWASFLYGDTVSDSYLAPWPDNLPEKAL